jgi:hypothetical protein
LFGTFVFFWWAFLVFLLLGLFWVCVCMCIFFLQYVTVVGIWVLGCESFCLFVVVCLSSLERKNGFLRWESSDCLRSAVAMPNSCLRSCWCFQLFPLWMWLLELLFSCVEPAKQKQ